MNNGGTSSWPITAVGAPASPNWQCGLSSRIAAGDINVDGYDGILPWPRNLKSRHEGDFKSLLFTIQA